MSGIKESLQRAWVPTVREASVNPKRKEIQVPPKTSKKSSTAPPAPTPCCFNKAYL